jgi:ADP-ribosylation factor GTPase-activating protein 2/3
MGVHTTFVRSLDLDEWTQRQIDAMRLGGNGNARKYFREHGWTDMYGKIEKKYTSKAAVAYRAELEKQVEAAAQQRGEGSTTVPLDVGGGLLENLSLQDQQAAIAAAAQARNNGTQPVSVAVPVAKLASQRDDAKGRLVVTPPTSGNLKSSALGGGGGEASATGSSMGMLRKPAGKTMNSKMLLKKPSAGASTKLRINKLSVGSTSTKENGTDGGMGEFEEDTPEPVPDAVAPPVAPVAVVVPTPAPVVAVSPEKQKTVMETGVSKLQAMNQDFFSGL